MNTTTIIHPGTVKAQTDAGILVEITSEHSCSACHAKSFCAVSQNKNKEILIPDTGRDVQAGEQVQVTMRASLGLSAVWWAYILPLFLLLIILLILSYNLMPEPWNALVAITGVAVYYVVLWLCRNRFKKKYVFEIEK